jgi:hypothetical protein
MERSGDPRHWVEGRASALLCRFGGRFDLSDADVADRFAVACYKLRQLLSLPPPDGQAQDFSRAVDGDVDPFGRGLFIRSVFRLRFQGESSFY